MSTRTSYLLKHRRMELHLRQIDVATQIGMDYQHYQRFEYDTRDVTKLNAKDFLRIYAVLELDPYELAFEDGVDLFFVER